MKILAVAVFAFALTVSTCHARLGETLDQCIARYGDAARMHNETLDQFLFLKNGLVISVWMLDGKAGREVIFKKDGSDLSETEKATLFEAERGGQIWKRINPDSKDEEYIRNDRSASGAYVTDKKALDFYTRDYLVAQLGQQNTQEKDKLKGF